MDVDVINLHIVCALYVGEEMHMFVVFLVIRMIFAEWLN